MPVQEFMSNVRYLLVGPSMHQPQAFFNLKAAEQRRERIEAATNQTVNITVEHLVDGEWVNSPKE
jgi:hypothetical protein